MSATGIELISADRRHNRVYENRNRNRYLLKLENEIKLQEVRKKISSSREVIINECLVNKLQEIGKHKFYNSIRRLKFLCSCFVIQVDRYNHFSTNISRIWYSYKNYYENFSLIVPTL